MMSYLKSIDPRHWFGMVVLMTIFILAMSIALGKVNQDTSYGLEIVLGCLTTMAGGYSQWAFSMKAKDSADL